MDANETCWYLRVTYADHLANEFLELGGAGWTSEAERDAEFASVPEAADPGPEADGTYILDVIEPDGFTHADDKIISEATARALLGEPLETLKDRARAASAAAIDAYYSRRAGAQ